ncbi:glycosyltransferase family 4 protein [Flavobacterium acetivorans]|uniref:glycosyltransferase family 4 protein n=1 Tax=Flavobacterium acetivorans TaxID=2893883 RepID=UPI001E41584C|nr:glycosyltransferase family 4 protein [Flavobacterium sp. F-29]UFH34143.1 glycosyltransferase family 4 protein [Flavobacterium sp. F-29]
MNILILTREYKHEMLPTCGGTGTFNATLAKELVKRGHNVYLFGISKTKIEFEDQGVKVKFEKNLFKRNHFINLARSISGKIRFLEKVHFYIHELEKKEIAKKLHQYINKNNLSIDIIETHDFEGVSLYLNDNIPYVIRCHGSYSVLGKYFGYKVEKGRLHCEKEAFKKAKNIISISKFSEKVNYELFGITKFKLIYNGIDTSLFKNDAKSDIIPKSIFYFGNTSVEKGADVAIRSFLEINKSNPETSLHFLGKKTAYKNEILKIISDNNITNKVHFYGIQQTEKVIEILSKANTVIFPSKGENFSLALLEAMSLSKTIICSDLDAYKEVVENDCNGYIAQTEKDFVEKIKFNFTHPNKALEIGTKARKTIIDNFSIEKMINETLDYYEVVIANHKKQNMNNDRDLLITLQKKFIYNT